MRTLSIILLLCLCIPVFGQNCSTNAGPDTEYCKYDGSFLLNGTPPQQNAAIPLNCDWVQISGPTSVNFDGNLEDPLIATTNGNGVLDPGTYVFRYCCDCTVNPRGCQDVTIEIGDDPTPASINSHPAEVCESITLTGTAPATDESADWFFKPSDGMLVENPGGSANQTTFTLATNSPQCREYTICYVINDGGCRSVDSTVVRFHSLENWNPFAFPGGTICTTQFNLYGNLPNCPGWTYNWSIVSQSGGTATIANPNSENTGVTVSGVGTYTFQITVGGSITCPNVTETVTVTVNGTTGVNLGNNEPLYYCDDLPSSIVLDAPFIPGVTYTWSTTPGLDPTVPSGPNEATFTPPSSTGNYTVSVTGSTGNGQCSDTKYFYIRSLPSISADADTIFLGCGGQTCYDLRQDITLSNTGFTPSAVVIDAPANSLNVGSTYSSHCIDLDVVGTYEFDVFVYIGGSSDPGMPDCGDTVRVVAVVVPGIDATNAGSDIYLCGDTSTTSLNGLPPTIPGTSITWTQIDAHPPVTFIPSNTVPAPQISGMQTGMGSPYMFQYSFGLGQGCEAIDTVFVYVDSCDCVPLDFELASCCENQLDSANVSGSGQKSPSLATSSSNIEEVSKYLNQKSATSMSWSSGDACDPCIDGQYPLWVELNDTIIGDPFNPYPGDSCYVISWSDGNITVQDWAIVAYPGITYTVEVLDTCTGCVWVDSFAYFCCEDIDIEITQCCFPEAPTAATSLSKGSSLQSQVLTATEQAAQKALDDYIKANGSSAVPSDFQNGCSDPCDNPTLPFPIWVVNNNTTPPTPLDAPYTFQWYNDDPTNYPISFPNSPLIFGYVGVTYWVEIVDSEGCVHTDTFRVDCCDPMTPTNLQCNSLKGQTVLTWDPVPGVTDYLVYVIRNDNLGKRACCPKGSAPQSLLPIPVSNPFIPVSQINATCYSWRVVAVCPDGTRSGESVKRCYPMPCLSVASPEPQKRAGEELDTPNWNIYPNPASSKLHIRSEGLHTGMKVMITDLLGKTVHQAVNVQEGSLDLNVSGLANGIYQLQIYHLDGSLSHSHKVLIQK